MERPIYTAATDDGVPLPIIDVTHPAFYANDSQQAALTAEFVRGDSAVARMLFRLPKPMRDALTRATFRGSLLGAEVLRADGSFLSGMGTYMMKLGPENLGAWAKPIDRRVAGTLPAISMLWRLHDMARLIADALEPALKDERPVHLVNIAGGPAVDSMNGLLLLHRRRSLDRRPVTITVLDGDSRGPAFGARALAAWKADGAPFAEVDVSLRHVRYDWRRPQDLARVLEGDAHVVVSSEGGLFEYGSDADIVENLDAMRGRVLAVVGSVTRADTPMQVMKSRSTAATILRGLDVFRALSARAGFAIARSVERPFSDQVMLVERRGA
jgi:hypothetical protein